jgi:hypothetical protein
VHRYKVKAVKDNSDEIFQHRDDSQSLEHGSRSMGRSQLGYLKQQELFTVTAAIIAT